MRVYIVRILVVLAGYFCNTPAVYAFFAPSIPFYEIKGNIAGMENQVLYLEFFNAVNFVKIDSVLVDASGNFLFKKNNATNAPVFVALKLSPDNWVTLIVNQETTVVNGSKSAFYKNYELVQPTNDNASLKKFVGKLQDLAVAQAGVDAQMRSCIGKPEVDSMRFIYGMQADSIKEAYTEIIKNFGTENQNSLLLYYAICYLNPNEEPDYITDAVQKLEQNYSQTQYYINYSTNFRAKNLNTANIRKGKQVPELALKDTLGNIVPLSSLHGKIVLIEFWESGCGKCEMNHIKLRTIYKKYHPKGFEIYGVALDENPEQWKKAIVNQDLTWVNVCELSGFRTSFSFIYDVKFTPQNYLIDRQGNFVARDLRGDALEYKIASLLK